MELVIANRTVTKAQALAEYFGQSGPVTACRFDEVRGDAFDLVINATSAGITGDIPPYPESAVNELTVCYDLSYGLSPTPFCSWAVDQGAGRTVMGWGMLVEQAAESFLLWRGVRPDTQPVLKQVAVSAS